jgi:Sulfotransferase family
VTLPDFCLIGAPKAGTTALHAALATHPELYLSRVKEPKYFLCGDQPPAPQNGPGDAHSSREWVWKREDYEALFAGAPADMLRGESTPLYLADPAALDRMHGTIPDAKLIVILRDPVDRAYSNWTHLWSDGLEPVGDFVAACDLEDQRQADGWAPFWRYLGLGRYGEQLQELYERYPREQVHVLRYRQLVDAPVETLNGICGFLGIDPDVVVELPSQNVSTYVEPTLTTRVLQGVLRGGATVGKLFPPQVWRKASAPLLRALKGQQRNRPELSEQERSRLVGRFSDDMALLSELTGETYDDWLSYRTGGTYSVRKSWEPSGQVAS